MWFTFASDLLSRLVFSGGSMFSHRFRSIVVGILIVSMFLFGYTWFMQRHGNIVPYKPSRDKAQLLKIFDQNKFWLTAEDNPLAAHSRFECQLDTGSSSSVKKDQKNLTTEVYCDKGVAKGFVSYHLISPLRGRILYVAVDDEHRRQGIAAKLFGHAVEQLEKQGVTNIELLTRVMNEPAQGLYRKYGFEPVKAYGDYVIFERK
jgi:ribosomal protein S18 acetylase RimI-like enzyme